MTDTTAQRPGPGAPAPPDESEVLFRPGEPSWCCIRPFRPLIDAAGFDWADPARGPGAILVKVGRYRRIWRVEIAGDAYFLKQYDRGPPAARLKALWRGPAARREWDAGRFAAAHGVAAVEPVACAGWHGSSAPADAAAGRHVPGPGASLLVTRAVPGARPLCDVWLEVRDDPTRASELARCVARLVARAHQAGFRHGDLHAQNILVRPDGGPLFVDLYNARTRAPVGRRAILANLAQLNQWFRRRASRTQRLRFLRAYLDGRREFARLGPFADPSPSDLRVLLAALDRRARRHARGLGAQRDRRARRDGRYFTRIRPAPRWRGMAVLQTRAPGPGDRPPGAEPPTRRFRREDWERWLADPGRWTDPARTQVLKESHSGRVCLAVLDALDGPLRVVAKRPVPRTVLRRLIAWFGPSRNRRAWRRAWALAHRDLPVARPLAYVERRLGPIRTDGLLLTEFVPGAADLEAFLLQVAAAAPQPGPRRIKDGLIDAIVRLLADLHERGFVHRDLKAGNLLVQPASSESTALPLRPHLTLIDMDGIRRARTFFNRRIRPASFRGLDRAAVRLALSLADCPIVTRTDRLRFLNRCLRATARMKTAWKDHWRSLDARLSAGRARHARRRDWKLAHYGRP